MINENLLTFSEIEEAILRGEYFGRVIPLFRDMKAAAHAFFCEQQLSSEETKQAITQCGACEGSPLEKIIRA